MERRGRSRAKEAWESNASRYPAGIALRNDIAAATWPFRCYDTSEVARGSPDPKIPIDRNTLDKMLAAFPRTSENQVSPCAAAQDDGKNSARLLVIRADFQDRNIVSDALETENCELVFQDFLGPLDEHLVNNDPFDAVLIDLSHPIESCFELLASIRSERPQTEVIFLSRLADEALWIESIQRGAYDFLPKPLDRRELRRIVTNAIEKNRLDAISLRA